MMEENNSKLGTSSNKTSGLFSILMPIAEVIISAVHLSAMAEYSGAELGVSLPQHVFTMLEIKEVQENSHLFSSF